MKVFSDLAEILSLFRPRHFVGAVAGPRFPVLPASQPAAGQGLLSNTVLAQKLWC